MKRSSEFTEAVLWLEEKISSTEFAFSAKVHPSDFTRKRSLSLKDYVLLILQHSVKSLSVRLSDFKFKTKAAKTCSKQAFSKGRLRLKAEAFRTLLRELALRLCAKATQDIDGYSVLAVDGTDINIPNTPKLAEQYGMQNNQGEHGQVQAHCSCLFNILNGVVLDVQVGRWDINERHQALEHLKQIPKEKQSKTIVLYDRGYPWCKLIAVHQETYKIPYIMRCAKNGFISEIRKTAEKDFRVTHKTDDGVILNIRVINTVTDGKEETFLTNLPDNEFSAEKIRDLYHKRWGIETLYNRMKNNLQIENFSGISEAAVLQDIYSAFLLANLEAAAAWDAQQRQQEPAQINRATTFGRITGRFYNFFYGSKRKLKGIINHMLREIAKDIITSTHKGQSIPRGIRHKSIKFPMNHRCMC